ncbi:MAG: NUDIX domain-containing protein [Pedococcus sp.]
MSGSDTRPRVRRRAMRVLLVDDADRLLLFRDSDPGMSPVPTWWITPGGGVEPGERDVEAAVREVFEETGVQVAPDQLVGPLATRVVVHGYSDVVTTQDEAFWFVRVPAFEVSTVGHTEQELLTMTAHRWWTRNELAATDDEVWPRDLLDLWSSAEDWLHAGRTTTSPTPVDLGTVEESTVPVRPDAPARPVHPA